MVNKQVISHYPNIWCPVYLHMSLIWAEDLFYSQIFDIKAADAKSLGTSTYGIDHILLEYTSFSTTRFKLKQPNWTPCVVLFASESYQFRRSLMWCFNTLRQRRNRRHFADDIFKCIFLHENVWISIEISLKFVPKGPINNIPALVQIMAWCRLGNKPLSEPMMIRLPMHICVTRPQWVNTMSTSDGIW